MPSRKISRAMVAFYVSRFTDQLDSPESRDRPPIRKELFPSLLADMQAQAAKHGDSEALRLAFDHLLGNPDMDCGPLSYSHHGFTDTEVRDIMRQARQTIWPQAAPIPPGGPKDVQLSMTPLEQWWARKGDFL